MTTDNKDTTAADPSTGGSSSSSTRKLRVQRSTGAPCNHNFTQHDYNFMVWRDIYIIILSCILVGRHKHGLGWQAWRLRKLFYSSHQSRIKSLFRHLLEILE
jgi:hypothetical protein